MGQIAVIAMMPVDTTGLPDVAQPFKPSIEHTLVKCDACQRDAWIGPQQLKHRDEFNLAQWCYHCVLRLSPHGFDVTCLDPNADETPRRT